MITSRQPIANLYDEIKSRIINNFSISPGNELRQILKGEIFTGGKPSLILGKIKHLSRGRCSDEVIKAVFMEQLPVHCRSILALSDVNDLTRMAHVADKIMAQSNEQSVAAVSTDRGLSEKVDALMALSVHSESHSRSHNRSYSRGRKQSQSRNGKSTNRSSNHNNDELCYYHKRFGNDAKKFKPTCPMQKGKSKSEN